MKFVDIKNDDEGLLTAFNEADKHNWKKEELIAYDNASMRIQDARGELELALERGIEQGIERGIEKGIEKGLEKGREGKEVEAVIGLYENEIPISIIAKSLKISEFKVLEIIEEHKKS